MFEIDCVRVCYDVWYMRQEQRSDGENDKNCLNNPSIDSNMHRRAAIARQRHGWVHWVIYRVYNVVACTMFEMCANGKTASMNIRRIQTTNDADSLFMKLCTNFSRVCCPAISAIWIKCWFITRMTIIGTTNSSNELSQIWGTRIDVWSYAVVQLAN